MSTHVCVCSVVSDSGNPGTVTQHSPLSMGLSWQEYWNGLPFVSSGNLPDPEIEPASPGLLQANPLPLCHLGRPYYVHRDDQSVTSVPGTSHYAVFGVIRD